MPYVFKHRVGSYIARDDIKKATGLRYTLDINEAKVFQDVDDAKRYEDLNFAHSGMVEMVEVSPGDVMPI